MHFAIVFAVFPVIFLGELPDKTMFASLVLATRGKPLAVWIGAATAFVVHVAIATTIGVVLFRIIPHRPLEGVVAAIFFAGGVLAIREAVKEQAHEKVEEELVAKEVASHRQIAIAAFVVIFLAEWGDLTQLLTANLAARYHQPLSVGVGALAALWTVAGIATVGGNSMPRLLNVVAIRKLTAIVLFGLAGYSVWNAVR